MTPDLTCPLYKATVYEKRIRDHRRDGENALADELQEELDAFYHDFSRRATA